MGRFEEYMKRVDPIVWATRVVKLFPGELSGNPPKYGKVVDDFREKYSIYISVYPSTDTLKDSSRSLVIHFTGRVSETNQEVLVKEELVSGNDYESVVRRCIEIATGMVENKVK